MLFFGSKMVVVASLFSKTVFSCMSNFKARMVNWSSHKATSIRCLLAMEL